MPIVDLQRRLREAGRIRIGDKHPEKKYPRKLDTFRFTSSDRDVIDAAAQLFGGQVKPWVAHDGTDQWEVITKSARIEVVVPPTDMAHSVYYELWSGGGCQRRCDGERELLTDAPCLCDPESRECTPHTRLSLIIPDLPVVGLFRLDTQGWNAATELAGSVDLARAFAARGTYLPAELRLEQREKRKPGEPTKKFVVPILDLKVSMRALGLAGAANGSLGNGEQVALPVAGFTPVPADLTPAPVPSIADQLAPRPRAPRANAAEPIPPTGVPVRERGQVSGSVPPGPEGAGPAVSVGVGVGPSATVDTPPADDTGPTLSAAASVAIWIKENCGDDSDEYRHHFLSAFSQGAYASGNDVPVGDMARVRATTVRVKRKELELVERDGRWQLVLPVLGFETTDPAGEHRNREVIDVPLPAPTLDLIDADYWKQKIADVPGVGVTTLVKEARRLAPTVGVEVPSGLDSMSDPRLVAALDVWLAEKRAS